MDRGGFPKWCHVVNLMEVTESISGSVVPLAMFDLGKGGWANAYKK